MDHLIEEIERIHTDKLESGKRTYSMQRLRVPLLEQKYRRTVTFHVGLLFGQIRIISDFLIVELESRNDSFIEHLSLALRI